MKKSLIAAAVASLALVSAANAKTVVYDKDGTQMYIDGRVMAVLYNTGATDAANSRGIGGNQYHKDSTIMNSARFGIGVSSPIGNSGFNAIAYAQWDMADADKKGNSISARDQWVGVDGGKWGKVIAGRFKDSLQYVTGVTDVYESWGQNATYNGEERSSGQIQYVWSGYGVTVKAAYQAAKDSYGTRFNKSDGALNFDNVESGGSLAVGYDIPGTDNIGGVINGPLSIRAGYAYYAMQDPKETEEYSESGDAATFYGDDVSEWAISVSWGNLSNGLYLSLMYNAAYLGYTDKGQRLGYDDTTYQGIEFAVGYGFGNGIKIVTGYQWIKMDTDSKGVGFADYDGETAGYIPLFIDWQLNPKFDVWVEGLFAVDADGQTCEWAAIGNDHDQQAVGIGARYNF